MTARLEARLALAVAVLAALAWLAPAAQAQVPRGRPGGPHWQQRVQRWDRLPAQRRQDILREQQRYRRLSPEQQQRLFEQYRRQRR
jgi:Spy/CpxP family protein refolding chaperone